MNSLTTRFSISTNSPAAGSENTIFPDAYEATQTPRLDLLPIPIASNQRKPLLSAYIQTFHTLCVDLAQAISNRMNEDTPLVAAIVGVIIIGIAIPISLLSHPASLGLTIFGLFLYIVSKVLEAAQDVATAQNIEEIRNLKSSIYLIFAHPT